jgi:hypothetical protein
MDWTTIAGTAYDGMQIYQAVERLKAAVGKTLGEKQATAGAQAGGSGGAIPYAGAIVRVIDFATAAVENPTVTAVGAGAVVVLMAAGAVALFKEVKG